MQPTDNFKKYNRKGFVHNYLLQSFLKTFLGEAKKLKVETVLDCGSGEGFVLSKLKSNKIGSSFEGLDISEDAISIGKKLFPDLKLGKGDIYKMPYKDNSFDLVICTEVLEHLENPEKALSEIRRVCKKYAIFSVPNEPFFRTANFIRGKNVSRLGNDIEHIQHWSSDNFTKLVQSQFRILSVRKPFPLILVVAQKIS